MAGRTARFGFNRFGGEEGGTISDDGQKYTSVDRNKIDHLFSMVERHTHRVPAADQELVAAPELSLLFDGSLEGGFECHYRFSIVDADGRESDASPEVMIALPDPLELPGVTDVQLEIEETGSLAPGVYYYAVTALRGEEETPLGGQGAATLMAPYSALRVTVPEYGEAEAFRVWRMAATDAGYTAIGVISAPDEVFIDDGSVPADPCACDPGNMPPAFNEGGSTYAVEVTLPEDVDLTGATAWRLYRSFTAGVYTAQSLVHEVVETVEEFDDDELVRSWVDDGSELLPGSPTDDYPDIRFEPFTFEVVDELPDASRYPDGYPILLDGGLLVRKDGAWVAPTGEFTFDMVAELPEDAPEGKPVIYQGGLHVFIDGEWVPIGPEVHFPVVSSLPDPSASREGRAVIHQGDLLALVGGAWEPIGGGGGGGGGGSPILTSPDGSRWIQTVENDGSIVMVPTLFPGPPTPPQNVTVV